ncbi:NADH-quinone oxidoreductase subunit C [Streptomyces nodosus]|uniref:NADH-quinone oxidoreductase subunit C n=1 Tax=Streptomyces nodosus TaxID=40318 RepID=UPI003454DD81
MTAVGWLPAPAEELFGPQATAEVSYDVLTVDVPATGWTEALRVARDDLGCTYFDWLSAVDEPGTGLRVSAHVVALSPVRRLLLRTTVPHTAPVLPSAVGVYAGAAWHERETHEMFGVTFEGHPAPAHLLLPEGFEGHPLRKDFVLAARVAKAWPGAKEPGESDHGGPKRRQMLPPGVPDPNEWGPLKGQLPPAPSRPARAAGRAAGDRPVRRTRTAAEGSTSQGPATGEPTDTPPTPRRARSASGGSASQRAPEPDAGSTAPAGPRRARSASQGSASQRTAPSPETPSPSPEAPASGPRRARSASEGSASQGSAPAAEDTTAERPVPPRGSDAPWHHARPAFDEPAPAGAESTKETTGTEDDTAVRAAEPEPAPAPESASASEAAPEDASGAGSGTAGGEDRPGDARRPGTDPDETPADDTPTPDDPSGGTP